MVSEYSKFPSKLKIDYFVLYWILVSTFVTFLPFFAMNKRRRTYEASGAKLVSFSEHLSFPSKLNLDYFIFCPILVSFSVIFIPFCYEQKKMQGRNRAVLYMFKRKQEWKTDYQHVISSKKSSGHLISVSVLKMHFDIYLYFSLNDRLLVIFLVTSR